jgi:hypothetical protein
MSDRPGARQSCLLAVALFLFAVALGAVGIGKGFAMLLTLAAFIFAIVSGILYVLNK